MSEQDKQINISSDESILIDALILLEKQSEKLALKLIENNSQNFSKIKLIVSIQNEVNSRLKLLETSIAKLTEFK